MRRKSLHSGTIYKRSNGRILFLSHKKMLFFLLAVHPLLCGKMYRKTFPLIPLSTGGLEVHSYRILSGMQMILFLRIIQNKLLSIVVKMIWLRPIPLQPGWSSTVSGNYLLSSGSAIQKQNSHMFL